MDSELIDRAIAGVAIACFFGAAFLWWWGGLPAFLATVCVMGMWLCERRLERGYWGLD